MNFKMENKKKYISLKDGGILNSLPPKIEKVYLNEPIGIPLLNEKEPKRGVRTVKFSGMAHNYLFIASKYNDAGLTNIKGLNLDDLSPSKVEGLTKWIEWTQGSMRGYHDKGKEIIKNYDIENEVALYKKNRIRIASLEYSKNRTEEYSEFLKGYYKEYYKRNKKLIDERNKSPEYKLRRNLKAKQLKKEFNEWKKNHKQDEKEKDYLIKKFGHKQTGNKYI